MKEKGFVGFFFFFCLFKINLFIYIVISPNTIFFPTVQHGDPVTHTCIHNFFFPKEEF